MDTKALEKHFNVIAEQGDAFRARQRGFHSQVQGYFRFHVQAGMRVLEVGCAHGDLLASLNPSRGVGIDLSRKMVERAQQKHNQPNLEFKVGNLETFESEEQFDVIILDYLVGYLPDVHTCIANLRRMCHARTRVHIVSLNHVWLPLMKLARGLRLTSPQPQSNWLSSKDIQNILELNGFEVVSSATEQILPFRVPLLAPFCNSFLVRLPLFRHFGMSTTAVARPMMLPKIEGEISCSVVVPARNESGNIRAALERIPTLGKQTEVIFVEGNSVDDTWEVIQREVAAYEGPHRVQYLQQPGKGKWDAVFAGFAVAKGDVLVIQDGDLTAPPEDLPKFYEAIASGNCEFANGCRLVYPMESQAMRFLNLLGNKFFATALSFVLGQPIKDSLCGTKMLLRADYVRLLQRIEVLGDFDPFGDFNLLFGSAMLDLRIRDILVRYRDRTYGDTNISRFRHGWILLRMTWFGLRKIRFFSLR
ncbi:bifunctional class I SAM-dependent methyltransferase/glycosyltransferase family 2 protein [Coraliomargarita sp. SDUM461004]|uniref:Bifunctional class I SAM-dependent methyltransferase/glycosyltransferase family 2 protein n=1 Tax=Thalassobacterium sedimentorum TaxID=3041258 RepID=A0ABU1AHL5_9BACT|nr:bifunctional class I SAM-dependent methyltransferase/glycosyltransferase family 2 protein [Coraliomargarita sp. SDUM461004]MDQ8194315.1 bifunctional class I SAM-dependent methyltransferase/glycosyltransferase family 2 protein [Coraliomargarita sp. SDUM461004]